MGRNKQLAILTVVSCLPAALATMGFVMTFEGMLIAGVVVMGVAGLVNRGLWWMLRSDPRFTLFSNDAPSRSFGGTFALIICGVGAWLWTADVYQAAQVQSRHPRRHLRSYRAVPSLPPVPRVDSAEMEIYREQVRELTDRTRKPKFEFEESKLWQQVGPGIEDPSSRAQREAYLSKDAVQHAQDAAQRAMKAEAQDAIEQD